MATPGKNATPKVDVKEVLKKKKQSESNKTMLIWGLIGLGVLVNAYIIYTSYIQIHYPLRDAGNGKFIAGYQSELKNPTKACNDIASELRSHRSRITSLDLQLSLNGITAEHIDFLSVGLVYLDSVKDIKITLSHNEIGDHGLYTLSQILGSLPSLQTLYLAVDAMKFSNEVLTQSLIAIGESKTLKHFTFSIIHNKIQDEGAKALVDGLVSLKKNLLSLNLILISNDFTAETGKILEEFIPTIEKATSLYISLYANKIGAEGGLHLGKGLEKAGNQIKDLHLDLFFNNITAVGAESVANGIGKMTQLEKLNLNLEFNYIEVEGAEHVGNALKNLTGLTYLTINVATKNFGPAGFQSITDALQRLVNLEELNIKCGVNKIGGLGIEELKLVYAKLTKLKRVGLDYIENSTGDQNGARVNQMLEALVKTEELDLNFNFNNLGEYGIAQILKGVQKLKNLKTLTLDVGNNEINDDEITEIFVELDKAGKIVPQINFSFLNTAITQEVADKIEARYLNHPSVILEINSTVAPHYLEDRKKKKEEQEKASKEEQNKPGKKEEASNNKTAQKEEKVEEI